MMTVNTANQYSGVKRDRCGTLPQSPTFGDLPPLPHPTSAFQKKLSFNRLPFTVKQEIMDEPCSPAAKLIKREYNVASNPFDEIFIRKQSSSESGSSENSPTSSTSSATSTSIGRGREVPGKKSYQPTFVPTNFSPPKVFTFNEHSNSPTFKRNSPNLFSFQQDNNRSLPPFCYNCKIFGHQKVKCLRRWYSWWPIEYMDRYRWLRGKLNRANQLRRQGMMDKYMQEARKIEREVEAADRKRQQSNFTEYRTGPPPQKRRNNNYGRYWAQGSATGREDGQKILHAIRRVKPPTPPAGCPPQHKFEFDCHKLIEDLQRQVNLLRFTLTNIKSEAGSPPNPKKFKSVS